MHPYLAQGTTGRSSAPTRRSYVASRRKPSTGSRPAARAGSTKSRRCCGHYGPHHAAQPTKLRFPWSMGRRPSCPHSSSADLPEYALMMRTHSARRGLTMSTSSRRSDAGRWCDPLATSRDCASITVGESAPGSFKQETSFCDGNKICPERISSPQGGEAIFGW